ncbi:Alpha-glucosidase [Temnothorax longispinosus]|uniref:alpha-glucosidase n=1 Tax=Temnothorax longispinosus TaxID=300112 RepID=A0A4S2KFU9_9HYME|nr:Alpha-glucosidase [Temnothorax longispinosus]
MSVKWENNEISMEGRIIDETIENSEKSRDQTYSVQNLVINLTRMKGIMTLCAVLLSSNLGCSESSSEWWQTMSLYQIYPRSFKDSDGDGVGDLKDNMAFQKINNMVSAFGRSAWTWREERQAYYLHHFTPEQPDLNYENENLNVLRFWLDKGVDGFRVDAVPHLCEDVRFLDEPLTGDPDPEVYGYTYKIYTEDQPRTYEIVKEWREVLNEYSGQKVMLIEAYTNMTMTLKYYVYGANFPFNFDFITDTNQDSKAIDFKRVIDRWTVNMPVLRATANWVTGNHDNSRLVTRYGQQRAEAITMITLLLPGVSITYNGEEIGMEDTWISWEDCLDPLGCKAGRDGYEKASRDPARTPFQWDDTISAGFSTNPKTWLPTNKNYVTLNVAAQKKQNNSYYALYKAVSALRKWPVVKYGTLTAKLLGDDVLVFTRKADGEQSVYVVVNFGNKEETVDLSTLVNASNQLNVYYATTNAHHLIGNIIEDVRTLKIPTSGAVICTNTM